MSNTRVGGDEGTYIRSIHWPVIEIGKFSTAIDGGALPAGWQPLILKKSKKQTLYTLVKDDGKVVVKADSEASASGLAREIRIDPKQYPIVQWRWKITHADPGKNKAKITRRGCIFISITIRRS